MPKLVLVTNQIPQSMLEPLAAVAKVVMNHSGYALMDRSEVLARIGEAHAVINQGELRVDEELLDAAGDLMIVSNVAIGTDNLDITAMTRNKVWATNVPSVFTNSVVEYAFGGMISLVRKLNAAEVFVRAGEWKSFEPARWDGQTLEGKTLGIIGRGNIGRRMAEIGSAFGMLVVSPHNKSREALHDLLPQCDFLSLSVPLTTQTKKLIGREELSKMRPSAILINVSRGAVVDEKALVACLRSKRIGGAVLDVFESEPEVPEELRVLDNVLLTPHIAGGTVESRRAARAIAISNVVAAFRGEVPPNALNDIRN